MEKAINEKPTPPPKPDEVRRLRRVLVKASIPLETLFLTEMHRPYLSETMKEAVADAVLSIRSEMRRDRSV